MIEKERLEELIKQGSTIYGIKFNKVNVYDLRDENICLSPKNFREYGLRVFDTLGYWDDIEFCNLFETKEDAEFYVEFSCIERTERLELPNWEEKNCIIFTFYSPIKKGGKQYEFRLFKGGNITIWRTNDMYKVFNESATKENYTLACRKAKQLFLGGE